MRGLVVAAVVTVMLVFTGLASAGSRHAGTWHWSEALADARLGHSRWAIDNGVESYSIDCLGLGSWIRSTENRRVKLYKHFDCTFTFVEPDEYGFDQYYDDVLRLHVTGRDRFALTR